jgi:signal transduction histidine kinase
MSFFDLDIRTFLRLLTIGNLVAMAMVFAYRNTGNHLGPMRLFVSSRLFQALAFGMISLRGEIPLWVSAYLSNPLLFTGFALEMSALGRLCHYRLSVERLLLVWVVVGSLAFWYFGNTPALLVAISSSVVGLIYGTGGLALSRSANTSRLKDVTAIIFLGFSGILLIRGYRALTTGAISVMTVDMIQSVTYLTQFSLLLVGTVGFLLLMKELDDQLLLESERRERERRSVQSNFIDMLTHELRSALSVVKMSGSSLNRQLGTQAPEVAKRLENIGRATDSMSSIVERCIELERLEQGEQPIRPMECFLLDIVTDLDMVVGPDGERLIIEINGTESVLADLHLLEVVLKNLIDNALKYALPGTPIRIGGQAEVRGAKPGFRLFVENQVVAGTAPQAAQMFVRFFRGANAHEFSGTGLGLYLVRRLVRMQDGDADYQADGEGRVSISVWLPVPSPTQGVAP